MASLEARYSTGSHTTGERRPYHTECARFHSQKSNICRRLQENVAQILYAHEGFSPLLRFEKVGVAGFDGKNMQCAYVYRELDSESLILDQTGHCRRDALPFEVPGKGRCCPLHTHIEDTPGLMSDEQVIREKKRLLAEIFSEWIVSKSLPLVLAGVSIPDLFFEAKTADNQFIILDSRIDGDVSFKNTIFNATVFISDTDIAGTVNLDQATFSDWLRLINCKFLSGLHVKPKCINNLELTGLTLSYPSGIIGARINALKYQTHLQSILTFNSCRHSEGEWDFSVQDCSRLAFLNQDMSAACFSGADVRTTRFDSCTWKAAPNGSPYQQVGDHPEILYVNLPGELKALQSLYRQLKRNLEVDQNFEQAGWFHYWEMKIRLLRLSKDKSHKTDRVFLGLYGLVADFGESYSKIFFLILLLIFGLFPLLVNISESVSQLWRRQIQICFETECFQEAALRIFDAIRISINIIAPFPIDSKSGLLASLNTVTMLLLVSEFLVLAGVIALFVMALRRRFRR